MPLDVNTTTPYPSSATEFRCWRCNFLHGRLFGVEGRLEAKCPSCTVIGVWQAGASNMMANRARTRDLKTKQRFRLLHPLRRCGGCGRRVVCGAITAGRVEARCKACKYDNVFSPQHDIHRVQSFSTMAPGEMMALMEERWLALFQEFSRRRAEVAVGLRFDVFMRDGFCCRYCGRSAEDGAILHADHVVARSKGGPTTLENLVTACFECNIGKSDKDLGDLREVI